MNIEEAIDFIKTTKQPAAYFDISNNRYRFKNLQIENNQRIYNYLSEQQNCEISIKG